MKHLQFRQIKELVLTMFFIVCFMGSFAQKTYYVDKKGSDSNSGTAEAPFLTINMAAQTAQAGDEVIVRQGIYREWVKPIRGGTSEDKRIIYKAAPDADVRILGSELAKGWEHKKGNIWKIELEDSFFGELNPFKTLTKHPERVAADEAGDGWGWLKYGRWTHRGDVIINGKGLTEKEKKQELDKCDFAWFTEVIDDKTVIYANFSSLNPNVENVELNARAYAFYPEKAGLAYITVKGFTFMNVATHWAPPTVHQPGAIGTNGGHHWIIEDNIIIYSKAVAISIGIPKGNADQNLSGYHIVRNNVILRCGQGGTAGQSWNSNSEIYNNHIEDINYRREFGGWETAAIKHHNSNNLVVRNNFIRGIYTIDRKQGAAHGIWNDYRNHNWNVSGNVVLGAQGHSILTEANWDGPNLYANNILEGVTFGIYSSRADAWVHNLFINSKQAWGNQSWGNRTQIGNSRWLNNMFIGGGFDPKIVEDSSIYNYNVLLDSAIAHPADVNAVKSNVPTKIDFIEENNAIYLKFILDKLKLEEKAYPIITSDVINLPFLFNANIDTDINGLNRGGNNIAGSFSSLKNGENKILIHQYSPLYIKALKLIDKNTELGEFNKN